MIFVAQTNFIVSTLYYHLTLVRILFVLRQKNGYYGAYNLMSYSEFKVNFNKIGFKLTEKMKVLRICQTEERVNPHSQLCAHKPRFRPY